MITVILVVIVSVGLIIGRLMYVCSEYKKTATILELSTSLAAIIFLISNEKAGYNLLFYYVQFFSMPLFFSIHYSYIYGISHPIRKI